MTEERAGKLLVDEVEKGLHLHHHLSPRRERAMFASLGFFVALAVTRGITTYLHYHGAGANGGIIIGRVHVHHEAFGIIGLVLLGYSGCFCSASSLCRGGAGSASRGSSTGSAPR